MEHFLFANSVSATPPQKTLFLSVSLNNLKYRVVQESMPLPNDKKSY